MWREDPSQAPRGGRRYRCIFSQSPANHVGYVSFDFKTVKHEVWLVLITRDGLLTLFEPTESESLSAWKELDAIYPFGQYSRGTEPAFKLSLHQSERPCYNAIVAGLDPRAISVAVSAMNLIKVFRAVKSDEANYQFHEVIEISTDALQINDVAWAPGCIRPYDLIAAACDDGSARIFEMTTPSSVDISSSEAFGSLVPPDAAVKGPVTQHRNTPSGIGAGLNSAYRAAARHNLGIAKIQHEWRQVALLPHDDNSAVWKVKWMHDGQCVHSPRAQK